MEEGGDKDVSNCVGAKEKKKNSHQPKLIKGSEKE